MNVWQCIPCGSQLWQLSGTRAICAKCGRMSASIVLKLVPVEPTAQTVEKKEVTHA